MIKNFDTLTPTNRFLLQNMRNPRRLMKVLGVELRNVHTAHFVSLGRPYTNLISPYMVNTPEFDDYHASVHILGQGGAIYEHKITGGTVYPKNSKYLAIPISAKARKWGSPKENRGPEMFVTKRGKHWFLQERSYVKLVRKKWQKIQNKLLHYILLPSVTHKPDLRATVPASKVFIGINGTCKAWFEQFKRAKPSMK